MMPFDSMSATRCPKPLLGDPSNNHSLRGLRSDCRRVDSFRKGFRNMTRLYVKESKAIGNTIRQPSDVYDYFRALGRADQESFWVVGLNGTHKIVSADMISLGGANFASVDQRIVFRRLLRAEAVAFVALHNHPSGNPTPSQDDRHLTSKLREAGDLLGIRLLDHLVITDTGYRKVDG